MSNLGISGFGGPLCETRKGYIISGFNYGRIKSRNQSTPISGFVAGSDKVKNKLKWQYPRYPDEYVLRRFRSYDTVIGLLRVKGHKSLTKMQTLHESGMLLNSFEFTDEKPIDFVILKNRIIALFDHHITAYTFQGKEIQRYEYDTEKRFEQSRIEKISDSDFIILGYDAEFTNAVIRRVSLEEKKVDAIEEVQEVEEKEEVLFTVKDMEIDEAEVLSLSIFPNPTSIYITFTINGDIDAGSKYKIDIFSIDGKPVYSQEFQESEIELQLSNFPTGRYFYRLYNLDRRSDSQIFSGQFIKVE